MAKASLSSFEKRLQGLAGPAVAKPSPVPSFNLNSEPPATQPSIDSVQQRIKDLGSDNKVILAPASQRQALSQLIDRGAPGEEAVRRTRPVDPGEFGPTGTTPESKQKPAGRRRGLTEDAFSATAGNLVRMGSSMMLLSSMIGKAAGGSLAPPKTAEQLQFIAKDQEKIATLARDLWEFSKHEDFTPQNKDAVGKIFTLATSTVPYIAATTASSVAAGPLGGLAVGWMVGGNSSYQTALDEFSKDGIVTDEERELAAKIGVGVGLFQGAIEAVGGPAANRVAERLIQKHVTNAVIRAGIKFSVDSLFEGGEEFFQELADITGESVYRDVNLVDEIPRLLEAGASGVLVGGIFRGAGDVARGVQIAENVVAGRATANEALDFALENVAKLKGNDARIGLKTFNDAELSKLAARAGVASGTQRAAEVLEAEIERRGKAERVKGEIAAEDELPSISELELEPIDKTIGEAEAEQAAVTPADPTITPEKPADAPAVEAKAEQPFEMTLLEFGKSKLSPTAAEQITEARQVKNFLPQHRVEVKAALARGDTVPPQVLKEFRGEKFADDILEAAQPAPAAEVKAGGEFIESKVGEKLIGRKFEEGGQEWEVIKQFPGGGFIARTVEGQEITFAEDLVRGKFDLPLIGERGLAQPKPKPKPKPKKVETPKPPETKRPAEQTTTDTTAESIKEVADVVNTDTTDKTKVFSPRQDVLEAHLDTLGRTRPMSKERRGWEEAMEKAVEANIPARSFQIANEILNSPRALSDIESAGLVVRGNELLADRRKKAAAQKKLTDPAEIASAIAELENLGIELRAISEALEFSGTERGRALGSQKFALDQDFDIVMLESRADVAGGKRISKDFKAKLTKLANALEAAETELASLVSANTEARAMKYIKAKITAKHLSRMTTAQKQANSDTLVAKLVQLTKDGCNF